MAQWQMAQCVRDVAHVLVTKAMMSDDKSQCVLIQIYLEILH